MTPVESPADGHGARARQTMPNVAIIDLRMPDTTGDQLCAALRRKFPDMAVVILSSYLSEETVRKATQS